MKISHCDQKHCCEIVGNVPWKIAVTATADGEGSSRTKSAECDKFLTSSRKWFLIMSGISYTILEIIKVMVLTAYSIY